MSASPYQRPLARGEACLPCKKRKVRCPGERPTCMSCEERHRHCTYPDSARSDNPDDHRTFIPTAQSSSSSTVPPPIPPSPPPVSPPEPPTYAAPLDNPFDPLDWLNPHFVSFLPSTGLNSATEQDQQYPNLEDLDLSWLLDTDQLTFGPDPALEGLSVQEHCFRLYFAHQRMFALEMHISTFYSRLSNPNPLLRPHPALCNAMCLLIAPGSPVASVREQEELFYEQATTALDNAIKDTSTLPFVLFDLVRAAILLAVWLWGKAREGEAVIMTSKAVRMAEACALEGIPSSVLTAPKDIRVRRVRRPFVIPPRNQMELAERIYAFWALYVLDVAASIPATMSPGLKVENIKTPLPRPWSDYESGNIGPDQYLPEVYDALAATSTSTSTELGYTVKSISLLHRAQTIHLDASFPIVSGLYPQPQSDNQFDSPEGSTSSLNPPLSDDRQQVFDAIQRFQDSLPTKLKTTITTEGGKRTIDPGTAKMQFILGSAQMYLFDTNDYVRSNDRALSYAKQMTGVIRLLGGRDTGELSEFIFVLWRLMARILIRESRKLVRAGREIEAALIDEDVDMIEQTIRMYLGRIAGRQAHDIRELAKGPPSDIDEEDSGAIPRELGQTEPHLAV